MKYLKTYNESFKLIEIRAKMGEMLQDIDDILLDVSDEDIPVGVRDNGTEINITIGLGYDSPYSSKMYNLSDVKDTMSRLDGYLKSNYDFRILYYIDRAPVYISDGEFLYLNHTKSHGKGISVDVNSFSNLSVDILLEEPTQMMIESIDNEIELRQTLQDIGLELRDEGFHIQYLVTKIDDPIRDCILLRITGESYMQSSKTFYISTITSVVERMIDFMKSEGFYCDFVVNSNRVLKTLLDIKHVYVLSLSIRFFKK